MRFFYLVPDVDFDRPGMLIISSTAAIPVWKEECLELLFEFALDRPWGFVDRPLLITPKLQGNLFGRKRGVQISIFVSTSHLARTIIA